MSKDGLLCAFDGKEEIMSDQYINIGASETLVVSSDAASRVLSSLSGDSALLLLYIMKNRGRIDRSDAIKELALTEERFDAALKIILDPSAPKPVKNEVPDDLTEPPTYTAKELAQAMGDKNFTFVRNSVEQLLGRPLHKFELNNLFTLYDFFKIPAEVIAILVNHLKTENERNSTPEHPSFVSFADFRRMAIDWQKRGITTADIADAYVRELELVNSGIRRCVSIMGLGGRRITASEKRMMEQFIALDPTFELIELAYEATVYNTGSLKWNYMLKILQSWHEKGFKTPEDVNSENDRRRTRLTADSSEPMTEPENRSEYEEQVLKFIKSRENGEDE